MANRADVIVTNRLADNVNVNLVRRLPDGTSDLQVPIVNMGMGQIHLPSPDVSLEIIAPAEVDIKTSPFHVTSDVDLEILNSRTNSTWVMKIIANDLPPDVPTTVNVDLGEEEPPPE
jgi:hypothetical protein